MMTVKDQFEERIRNLKKREKLDCLIGIITMLFYLGPLSVLFYFLHQSIISSLLSFIVPFVVVAPIRFVLYLSEVKRIDLTADLIREKSCPAKNGFQ